MIQKNFIKKSFSSIIIGLMVLTFAMGQGPNFSISFTASGDGETSDLTVGFSPYATDGNDENIDMVIGGPSGIPGDFYAGLNWNNTYYSTQIVHGSNDDLVEHAWTVTFQFPSTNVIELTWDNAGWETLGTIVFQDAFGGVFGVDVDMTTETSFTLNNPAIPYYFVKIVPLEDASISIPPIANAGLDQIVMEMSEVQLDGTGSYDPGFGEITYYWESLNGITLSDPTIATPQFTAADVSDTMGVYFSLTVTDEDELVSDPDTVKITIQPFIPTASAGGNQTVDQGTIVELDGSNSSDPSGSDLLFTWSVPTINGQPITLIEDNVNLSIVSFVVPDLESETELTFTLLVENEEGFTDSDAIIITVLENKSPVANSGMFLKTFQGGSIRLNGGQSFDVNHDELSFVWTCEDESVLIDNPTTVKPIVTLPTGILEVTDYTLTLTVTDEHGLVSDPDVVTVTAVIEGIQPPTPPNVYARVEHQKVVLAWDAVSESSIDPMTGYSDFEGYKVYRSKDGGKTWGTVIYDTFYDMDPTVPRDTVGWVPIAQYDLDEEQDIMHCIYENDYSCDEDLSRGINIEGLDPLRTEISLGTNNGLTYTFVDTNVIDGIEYTYAVTAYDMGLPTYKIEFVDEEGDGTYREVEEWSSSNPEHFINAQNVAPNFGASKSLECSKTTESNFVTVIPGYYATNITFPDIENTDNFIIANEGNVGSGDRFFGLVDVNALTSSLMRFEIEASIREGSYEENATDNPELYVYEITDLEFQEAASWNEIDYADSLSASTVDSLLKFPGAKNAEGIIYLPDYKLQGFPLLSEYDIGYQSNWTDFFDGIRLRFDNNIQDWYRLEAITDGTYEAFIDEYETNMDSISFEILDIRLEYSAQSKFEKRPLYEYKIEFSTSTLDTAHLVVPSSGCAELPQDGTLLPFRITNLTTGIKVDVVHTDKGTTGDEEGDQGYGDCRWERNEKIALRWEEVMIDSVIEDTPYIYDLIIDFRFFHFLTNNIPDWAGNQSYEDEAAVKYADMVWGASEYIVTDSPAPNVWIDDGTGNNLNPWKPEYGWKDGDYVILKPERWYVDGDSWVADLSLLGKPHEVTQEEIEEVTVVPNPYIVHSEFNETSDSRLLQFIHLPQDCQITIYTITGEYVTSFEHHDEYFSYEYWDLRSDNNQEVAPGLYIFRVESDNGKEFLGKFAVVR